MKYTRVLTLLTALLHSSVSGAIVKRSADDSPQQCSYSFNVLASTGETCPSSAPSADGNFTALATTISAQYADVENKLNAILARLGLDDNITEAASSGASSGGGGGGVNYKRWGRTTCPATSSLIYEGEGLLR